MDFRIAIEIGGIRIRPGDFLFGDIDGGCVVPVDAADETFIKALEKAPGEVERELHAWDIAPGTYVYHAIDLTDSSPLTRVVKETFERYPQMDTVLGHAGRCGRCGLHPFATTSEQDFERIFRVLALSSSSIASWGCKGISTVMRVP